MAMIYIKMHLKHLSFSLSILGHAIALIATSDNASDRLNWYDEFFETHSFMTAITVHCPRYQSDRIYLHCKTPTGHVRYRCPACKHVFQLTYSYEARKPGVKDKIVDIAFNGAGIRDTARVLKISIDTVMRALKNSPQDK